MIKTAYLIFLLVNLVALFCAINPWFPQYQSQGVTILVVETIGVLVIGLPLILFQIIVKKQTFREALHKSVETVLNFISSF